MEIRKQLVFGSALALAIAAAPAQARVGVDEEGATPGSSRGTVSAPSSEGGSETTTAGYDEKEGGFVLRSSDGENRLVIGGRVQSRFDAIGWDDALEIENTVTFQIRRARLYFLGNLMGKENSYYVQIGADGTDLFFSDDTFNRSFELYDAWFKHECSEAFAIKAGQFKVPFSRQFLTSSGKLQFPDRSVGTSALTQGQFGFDFRDVGAEASGGFNAGKVQYALALVNGDGRDTANFDDNVAVYGRLSLNPTGDYGYSEGDLDGSETLASTVGLAVHYQADVIGAQAHADITRWNLDGGLKKNGASVQGEFYSQHTSPADGESVTDNSFYIQGGWFLRPHKLEAVARVSRLLLDGDDNDLAEYAAGLNYYMMGHRLKWQGAYSYYDDDNLVAFDNLNHHRFTAAAQFWF